MGKSQWDQAPAVAFLPSFTKRLEDFGKEALPFEAGKPAEEASASEATTDRFRTARFGSDGFRSHWHCLGGSGEFRIQFRGRLHKSNKRAGHATILFSGLFDHARLHEVLQFFVGAQPQHLLAATRRVSRAQIVMDDEKERFEFKRSVSREHGNQFLRHPIGATTRETVSNFHGVYYQSRGESQGMISAR